MIIHVWFLDLVQPDVDLCVPIYSVNVVLNLGIVTQHRNIIIHMIINVRNLIIKTQTHGIVNMRDSKVSNDA